MQCMHLYVLHNLFSLILGNIFLSFGELLVVFKLMYLKWNTCQGNLFFYIFWVFPLLLKCLFIWNYLFRSVWKNNVYESWILGVCGIRRRHLAQNWVSEICLYLIYENLHGADIYGNWPNKFSTNLNSWRL